MMRPRVVHVISNRHGVGGAERLLAALVREGDRRSFDQLVLNPFAEAETPELAALVPPATFKSFACRDARSVWPLRRWVERELDAFEPDVVHTLLYHASVVVASLRRHPSRRHVVTNVYGEGIRAASHARAAMLLDRFAGYRCDRILAISDSVERFLLSEYRHRPSKVTCVPLGWEGSPLPPDTVNLPPTIVCVAKFRREKGHSVLLRAFQRVRQRLPDAQLLLVGEGELNDQLVRLISELNLTGSVQITGPVQEVWPYLSRAHVFALASTTEAYGLAVVEAMAAGLPVVASAVGGIPELVVPGITGELVPPGDEEALAQHLENLLRSPEVRARMATAAREASQPLTMQSSVSRYLDIFEEIVQGSRNAADSRNRIGG